MIELASIVTSNLYRFGIDFGTTLGPIWEAFGLQTWVLQLVFPSSLAHPLGFCLRGASKPLPGTILGPFCLYFGTVFASYDNHLASLMRAGGVPRSANNNYRCSSITMNDR